MKDLMLIAGIVIFWFGIGTIYTFVSSDASVQESLSLDTEANYTHDAGTIDTLTFSDSEAAGTANPLTLFNMLKFMWGFSAGTSGFPAPIAIFISFINWILTLFGILLVYRLIRSGAG